MMAATCDTCGQGLSMFQRARGRDRCDGCTEAATVARDAALLEYDGALAAVAADAGAEQPVARLRELEEAIAAGGGDYSEAKAAFYRSYLDKALADEVLTADEEQLLDAVAAGLFPPAEEDAQMAVVTDFRTPLFIAMVNDGRLPEISESRMALKKGEVLHLEQAASLLKEVVQREYQAGSRGVSFRIMKGVSYRVGSTKGKMVEVGRSWEPVDDGALCVTSRRAVFTGARKTIEMPYSKLLDVNVYTDAIEIHLSGRQTPSVFRVSSGPLVAAAINAASQNVL